MLNKLHVNLEKSCFMYFNKTTTDNDYDRHPPIMIGSTEIIKRVSKIKFLGVLIDGNQCQVTD